jgi:5-methylcytosine-specific restriction endonuclease McrA
VHHRDHDPSNRAPENLEALCRSCHEREHTRGARVLPSPCR